MGIRNPSNSKNNDVAWELITIMTDPKIITPMLQEYGYLHTRISIGDKVNSTLSNTTTTVPYYRELVSMIKIGHTRPNIPEFPQIADHIREALNVTYYNQKDPKQALDDAATKSAKILGWLVLC